MDQQSALAVSEFHQRKIKTDISPKLVALAEDAVKDQLKDPDSAKFYIRFESKSPSSEAVCGFVNARNSYGGYTGKTPFSVEIADSKVKSVAIRPFSEGDRFLNVCGGMTDELHFEFDPHAS